MPVLAFDLGGTKLAGALFSDNGEVLYHASAKLEKRSGTAVGLLIQQQAQLLLEQAKEKELSVDSAGICIPGIAYAQTGHVWAPNIPGWDNYPLRTELEAAFDSENIRVAIDSDRACSMLGEIWKGNAQGCRDAIFLAVGTGIGAGILSGGHVVRGGHDIAGAIGWLGLSQPYEVKYDACGCFEYHASGEGLVRVAKEYMKDPVYASTVLPVTQPEQLNTREIFAALDKKDALAVAVLQNAVRYWGMAVANLVSLFNPEKIIFGGGVFGPALPYLDAIYEEACKWAQPIAIKQVVLQGSALGTEAGLYGAGKLAIDRNNE